MTRYRVMLEDADDAAAQERLREIIVLGCGHERVTPRFNAILERGHEAGGWTFEEGHAATRSIGDDVRRSARLGDVAVISLDGTRVAYVHFLAQHPVLDWYVGVLAGAHERSAEPPLAELAAGGYALLGHTDGFSVEDGTWPLVGRVAPDPAAFVLPRFRRWQGGPDRPMVVATWDGQVRVAEPDEIPVLLSMDTRSSNLIRLAARALHGLEPWHPSFDDLRPERVARSHGRAQPGEDVDPRPFAPVEAAPETPTEFFALLQFTRPVEAARAALDADGWTVSPSVEDDLVEATRTIRCDELDAFRDRVEAPAAELGADDFGYEYALPR